MSLCDKCFSSNISQILLNYALIRLKGCTASIPLGARIFASYCYNSKTFSLICFIYKPLFLSDFKDRLLEVELPIGTKAVNAELIGTAKLFSTMIILY